MLKMTSAWPEPHKEIAAAIAELAKREFLAYRAGVPLEHLQETRRTIDALHRAHEIWLGSQPHSILVERTV